MTPKNIKIVIAVLVLIILGVLTYFSLTKKPTEILPTSVQYKNTEYGFTFDLPQSWTGYSVIVEKWEGNYLDNSTKTEGPKISIRHPAWTAQIPRQDIPVMVFSIAEWNSILEEKLSVGAAPIGPSELGRNSKYVFALPARYNFAFPVGFEEVETVLQQKPLKAF
ncbi:MAG: hypothetical protein QG579_323 [Patescibacteria group bacterium]|jgi:hypothetical protein|nr:hypothetical protein [Patescibacteria group bacterium]